MPCLRLLLEGAATLVGNKVLGWYVQKKYKDQKKAVALAQHRLRTMEQLRQERDEAAALPPESSASKTNLRLLLPAVRWTQYGSCNSRPASSSAAAIAA